MPTLRNTSSLSHSPKTCEEQLVDGTHCRLPIVESGMCFWHSTIPKTDEMVKKYCPPHKTVKALIETKRPLLQKARLTKTQDLAGVRFDGMDLQQATFHYSNVSGSTFLATDLRGTVFRDCIASATRFDDADLTRARFERTQLANSSFENVTLRKGIFDRCDLQHASFKGSDVRQWRFDLVELRGADITGVRFSDQSSQLRFTNSTDRDIVTYLTKSLFAWQQRQATRADAVRALDLLKQELDPAHYAAVVRRSGDILARQWRERSAGDHAEFKSLVKFYADAINVIGDAIPQKALPAPMLAATPGVSKAIRVVVTFIRDPPLLTDLSQTMGLVTQTVETLCALAGGRPREEPLLVQEIRDGSLEITVTACATAVGALMAVATFIVYTLPKMKMALKRDKALHEIEMVKLEHELNKVRSLASLPNASASDLQIAREFCATLAGWREVADDVVVQVISDGNIVSGASLSLKEIAPSAEGETSRNLDDDVIL